jgi:hypothetical protein
MQPRSRSAALVAALLAACAATATADNTVPAPSPTEQLQTLYPGVQFYGWSGRTTAVYGVPMTSAGTALDAARMWLAQHEGALGVGTNLDLRVRDAVEVQDGKFTVVALDQWIDGVPVDFGMARVLVRNDMPAAGQGTVVYVGAKLAREPDNGFAPVKVAPEAAVAIARGNVLYRALPSWTEPELVVWHGEGDLPEWREAVKAWRFVGTNQTGPNADLANPRKFTFFVDASTGQILNVRNEICFQNVTGTVRGNATPGLRADSASNPPTNQPILGARVTSGSNFVFTDRTTGAFDLPVPAGPASVTTGVQNGFRVNIVTQDGTPVVTGTQGTTSPGTLDFFFNSTPTASATAQLNVLIHTNLTYWFLKDRIPQWTGIDAPITGNIGVSGTCNAFYNGTSINFYNAGGGCNNTAFSTVIAHEYGHHVVNRRGLTQGGFGEGYSDALAIMLYDTGIVGQDFTTSGGFVRNPEGAQQQFPCASTAVHTCGQIVGGTWRWIRNNWVARDGVAAALPPARQLFASWTLITLGGQGSNALNSAHPQTAIEVLTLDDNDGILSNGTPNYGVICPAFDRHNIDCPVISVLAFEYPNGRPTLVAPGLPADVRVNVVGVNGGVPQPGATVSFRIGTSGAFTTQAMTSVGTNQYVATLPAATCGDTLQYYFSASAQGGATVRDPETAPTASFSTLSATSQTVVADVNFNTNPNWTVTNTAVTDGAWARGTPAGGGTREDPASDFDGSGQAFVTGLGANADLDGGPSVLTTVAYDLSAAPEARVSYARWFQNDDQRGGANDPDRLTVQFSADNGATWTTVETVGHVAGWVVREWRVADFVPTTSTFRVRFQATDNPNDSVAEAAIDRFRIAQLVCAPACRPDFNGDGELTFDDIQLFVSAYNSQQPSADFNNDGEWTFDDIQAFVGAYNSGC